MKNLLNTVESVLNKNLSVSKLLFSEDVELVKLAINLIDSNRVNVNQVDNEGKTALFRASYEVSCLLINAGIDINHKDNNGNTALFFSDYLTTDLLIRSGAQVNIKNANNMTAMFGADIYKARTLIKSGARIYVRSKSGFTALDYSLLRAYKVELELKYNEMKILSA